MSSGASRQPRLTADLAEPAAPAVTAPRWDLMLFGVTLILSAFGLVMVYSASAVYAMGRFGSDTHFAFRQLAYLSMGLSVMLAAMQLDYRFLARWSRPMLIASVVLLVVVLIPGVGVRVGGAQRWFRLGPLSLQPSELAKVALMIYLATILADENRRLKALGTGFVAPLLVVGLVTGLTLMQPDLGTAVLLGLSALMLMFIAGTRLIYLLGAGLIAAPLAWFAVVGTPWRLKRLMAFFDPEGHKEGAGYQVYEALLTLGSGGLSGVGLGEGQQKLFYLPEAHTDFILPVIGQELGFLGVSAIIILFGLLLWRGARVALGAGDRFGRYLAIGFTMVLGFQACMNMAVVVGVMPTKGITLPFVSYGGTSLVSSLFMVGILLSVSRGVRRNETRRSWGLRAETPESPRLRGTPMAPVRISSGGVWRAFKGERGPPQGGERGGEPMRVLIAGGGTGGHLFPGIAVAEEVLSRGGEVLFVGTARGIEAKVLPALGLDLETIRVGGLAGVSWRQRLRFVVDGPIATVQAIRILRRFRPQVVAGVGGYSSGPVVLTAALGFVPTVILEQNSVPGVTNRLLGRVVRRIFGAFEESRQHFPGHKMVLPGNPVRRAIVDSLQQDLPAATARSDGRLRVFAFGGSQGARFINECLMEAAPRLAQAPVSLVHQTGEADHARVQAAYADAGLDAEVHPFISDMAARYAWSDLIVSRAGATTLAELAIVGRPAVLIPFPYATHNHQERNAREFEEAGAALCRPQDGLDGPGLAALIGQLADDEPRRSRMADAMGSLARPRAAADIVDALEALAGDKSRGRKRS